MRVVNYWSSWHGARRGSKVTFYSGQIYASICGNEPNGEKRDETPAYDWSCVCCCLLCGAGECPGAHGDAEEHQGNRCDHARPSRLVHSILLSRRQPEADRVCDGHLLQNR